MFRGIVQSRGNWVRESEHIVLRLVSLVFSIGSAYAVRTFFEPLDAGDPIHYILWWIVSAGFGLLGFYLSRSLMHRMMSKEPIWAYAPIFLLVEFFEILCNYTKAVSAVWAGGVPWVVHAPPGQLGAMTVLTYIGWSILPLVSPAMAVADMDMTRRRNGESAAQQRTQGAPQRALAPPHQQGQQSGVPPSRWGNPQGAPKQVPGNSGASSQAGASQQVQRSHPQGGAAANNPLPGVRPAPVAAS